VHVCWEVVSQRLGRLVNEANEAGNEGQTDHDCFDTEPTHLIIYPVIISHEAERNNTQSTVTAPSPSPFLIISCTD